MLGILSRSSVNLKPCNCSVILEFVRWRRKPRWLPVAKTKMFRVPERTKQEPEEKVELLRLHNQYRTQMRSVRLFLREEAVRVREITTADHFVITPEEEEEEFKHNMQINDAWNATIAAEREERLQKQFKERRDDIANRLVLAEERKEEHLEKIDEIVRREKERSKTFITREKLDAAIDFALANPVDYNFAIDLNGNMYQGRATVPTSDLKPPKSQKLADQVEATN